MTNQTPEAATARIAAIDTDLAARPAHDPARAALVHEKIALHPIAHPPAQPTAPTGPTWRERQQHRLESAVMRKEAEAYPPGHSVREEIFRDVADHAAEFQASDAAPGDFTERDVLQAAAQVIPTESDRARFRAAASHAGATNQEAMQLAWDIRDADPASLDPIHQHPDGIDLDELWGSKADENIRLVQGLMAKLSQADRDELVPYVKHIPAVTNRVLAIARRQKDARVK